MKLYLKPFLQGAYRILSPPKTLLDLETSPIWEKFGLNRGQPIDRFYIEEYLSAHRHLITGHVMEIAENTYTLKYGNKQNMTKVDILHVDAEAEVATLIEDLTNIKTIHENMVDTFICTQTLNFIYDTKTAVKSMHKILKVNGKALVTVAGLSQISRFDMDRWGDYWRFTDKSLRNLLSEVFGEENVEIQIFGNSYSATMLLQGVATEEVDFNKIAVKDPNYQVILGAIITKRL